MQKTIIRYGLLSGTTILVLLLIVSLIGFETFGFEYGQLIGYSSMLLAMLFVFFGIRSYRSSTENGLLSFWQGFKTGIGIALIACLFYTIGWLFINEFIYPDFMDEYTKYYAEQLKSGGLSAKEIEAKMNEMNSMVEMYKNPLWKFTFTFLEIFPVGLIVSLISALVLKKK